MKAQQVLPPVKGLVENSLIEWPGKISLVIFLAGCNFRCPFCHSKTLVLGTDNDEAIPFDSIRNLLADHRDWIDGTVVTGGEPTVVQGLDELLLELKGLGTATRLNTNGSRPDVLKRLAREGLLDSVAMDVKAPLTDRYSQMAGVQVDLSAISETIDWLTAGGVGEVEFRTTVIPTMVSDSDVIEIARRLGPHADYVLQPFRPLDCLDASWSALPAMAADKLLPLAERAGKFTRSCLVRGMEAQTAVRQSAKS